MKGEVCKLKKLNRAALTGGSDRTLTIGRRNWRGEEQGAHLWRGCPGGPREEEACLWARDGEVGPTRAEEVSLGWVSSGWQSNATHSGCPS